MVLAMQSGALIGFLRATTFEPVDDFTTSQATITVAGAAQDGGINPLFCDGCPDLNGAHVLDWAGGDFGAVGGALAWQFQNVGAGSLWQYNAGDGNNREVIFGEENNTVGSTDRIQQNWQHDWTYGGGPPFCQFPCCGGDHPPNDCPICAWTAEAASEPNILCCCSCPTVMVVVA